MNQFLLKPMFIGLCGLSLLTSLTESIQASSQATIIRVDRPVASVVFQSRDIVVSPDGQRLASAAQAKWIETMPTNTVSDIVNAISTANNKALMDVAEWVEAQTSKEQS